MAKLLKRLRSGSKESLKTRLEELERKLQTQDEWYTRLERKNKDLYEENLILKREKDELLRRLSKAAGDQLTRGNAAIADLSDQNRPTKLGEKWTSLYTDEWVDAYEELRNDAQRNQPRVIEKQLLDIVNMCYRKCHEIAEDQLQKARFSLNGFEHYLIDDSPDRNRTMISPTSTRPTRLGELFIDEVINNYKTRRKHDTDWIQAVSRKLVYTLSQKGVQLPQVLKFTGKCAELCWFMCVSDPPLVLEYEQVEGQPIDRSKFNLYDRTGSVAEYAVWPALLLHKNGPILAKGTIQAVQSFTPRQKTTMIPSINENKIRVINKPERGSMSHRGQDQRVLSSRFPEKQYTSVKIDRTSKSSGNAREPQRQGIIYYNERAQMILNDKMPPVPPARNQFSYNYSNAREITVNQTPRSRVSNFGAHVLIGRNKTSMPVQHVQKPDFNRAMYGGTQKIIVANQTTV